MKKILLMVIFGAIFVVLVGSYSGSQARRVVAIASKNAPFYTNPLAGFQQSCQHNVVSVILTDNIAENNRLLTEANVQTSDLVLLIGSSAAANFDLNSTRSPIVYCMILNPTSYGLTGPDITGISLDVPVSTKIDYLKTLSPQISRLGLLYNPDKMQNIANELSSAAANRNITLFPAPVRSSAEIANLVKNLKERNNIDALFLPMDSTLLEKRTFEYISLFTIQNRIALVTPTAKYVKMGGLMAADVDLRGVGRQAGNIANRIIAGTNPASIPPEDPREIVLALNSRVASLIGLRIPSSLMNSATIYQ